MVKARDYTLDCDTDYSFDNSVDAWLKANRLIAEDKSLAPIKIIMRQYDMEIEDYHMSTVKVTHG